MARRLDRIEEEALRLGSKSRAALAERLLQSLESASDSRSEREWLDEAERRDREIDMGANVDAIPARVLLRRMKSEIARKRRTR